MAKKIAAVLARVSRPTQNMESQVNDLLQVAQKEGYTVPKEFIFSEQITGINSGFKKSLDSLLLALDDKRNHIEAVFIWEITRLSRGAYDFVAELMQINSKEVPVYFLDMDIWTWDFANNCLSRENCDKLVGASTYGRMEWEKIKKRTKRGRDAVAEKGLFIGHLADGYIRVIEGGLKHIRIDEERSKVIKWIFDMFIQGKSTDEIADILNAEGTPTTAHYRYASSHFNYRGTYRKRNSDVEYDRTKLEWSGSTISTILRCTWYVGKRYYDGKEYHVDPIIAEDVWTQAKRLREERGKNFRSARKSKKHKYLLSNLVVCGECGRKFYGHYTGKNNHYFCSSVESGTKCSTRGINKENFEAIVCMIVRARALYKTLLGENDATSDFFKTSENDKITIKKEIQNKQAIIDKLDNEITKKQDAKDKYYEMYAEGDIDKESLKRYLSKNEQEKTELESRRESYMVEFQLLKKRLNATESIKSIISRIQTMSDTSELRKLLEATVKQITVYTIDSCINYVVITYLNDKHDNFIYSFKILKHDFLTKDVYTLISTESGEVNDEKVGLRFDPEKKVLIIPEGYALRFNTSAQPKSHRVKSIYEHEIDFRSFIYGCIFDKDYQTFRVSYDPTPFIEDDERRAIQAKREKEYQKKRNSGLPTTLPFVVRDGNYDDYCKQRKHLYNRRYKIKNNKSLTDEEKRQRLQEVDRQLALLKTKVKYLKRDEAVKEYRKKQNL